MLLHGGVDDFEKRFGRERRLLYHVCRSGGFCILNQLGNESVSVNQHGYFLELFVGSDPLKNLDPVEVRHHNIEQNGIGTLVGNCLQRGLTVTRNLHLKPDSFERDFVKVRSDSVVFHE